MSELDKDYLPTNVTTDFSMPALGRLLNVFSGITGGGKEYVPEGWIKLFSSGKAPTESDYQKHKGPGKVAHILAKIGAGAVAYGGAAYLLRAFMHSLDIDNIQSVKAGNRASQKLETTKIRPIAPALNGLQTANLDQDIKTKKKKEELNKSASHAMALGALPPITALAAVVTAFKLADKTFDKALGKRLDKELAEAETKSQELAINRIRRNRGLQEDQIQKAAAFQGIQAAIGLLLATVAITGGIAGFNWHRSNSPAVAKYKAYKKGLETYNKRRALDENIENVPLNKALVEELDSSLKGNKKTAPVASDPMNEVFV